MVGVGCGQVSDCAALHLTTQTGIWQIEQIPKINITDSKSTCHVINYKVDFRYQRTNNVDAIRRLLGQSSVTATSAYLGVSDNSALELSRKINV